jgi:glucose-6-phosphate 1-dehydrogenase
MTASDETADNSNDQPAPLNGAQPAIIVIFGVTGDLARRFLMPSLYHLFKQGLLHEKTEIVGVSRRKVYLDDLFNKVEMCISEADNICDPVAMARMHSHTRIERLDMDDPADYSGLLEKLNQIEEEAGVCMNRLYYLSIPPKTYPAVIENMG